MEIKTLFINITFSYVAFVLKDCKQLHWSEMMVDIVADNPNIQLVCSL